MHNAPNYIQLAYAIAIGAAFLFALPWTIMRLERPRTRMVGFGLVAAAYASMIGMAFVFPQALYSVFSSGVSIGGSIFEERQTWLIAVAVFSIFVTVFFSSGFNQHGGYFRNWIPKSLGLFVLLLATSAVATVGTNAYNEQTGYFGDASLVDLYFFNLETQVFLMGVVSVVYFLGPIMAVFSIAAILERLDIAETPSISFEFIFEILAQLGVTNLTWQIVVLSVAIFFGLHSILSKPIESIFN